MNKEQSKLCIKAVLLAVRKENYTVYVFENLDVAADSLNRYIMCTKCPNWVDRPLEIGQMGFLSYRSIIAGIDKWFNREDSLMYHYKYTANYFDDFVPVTHVVLGGMVVEQQQLIVT